MGRSLLKNFLAVAVALVVTLGAVTVLSAATKASPDAAKQYSYEVRREETQVAELSAPAHTQDPVSLWEAAGGFVLILGVSAGGAVFLLRAMQKGRVRHTGRGYQPRRDMAHGSQRKARRV